VRTLSIGQGESDAHSPLGASSQSDFLRADQKWPLARSVLVFNDVVFKHPVRGNNATENVFGNYRPRSSGDGIGAAI